MSALTYRLKRGKHQQTINGKVVVYSALDPAGKPRPGFTSGDEFVTSSVDLIGLFGQEKFERVPDDQQPQPAPAPAPAPAAVPDGDGLEGLTVAQLRTLAAEEEVDLGPAKRKAELVGAIREAGVNAN